MSRKLTRIGAATFMVALFATANASAQGGPAGNYPSLHTSGPNR